jgi:hypothetical protein
MNLETLPPFLTARLDQLRRHAGHAKADAGLAREQADEAQRRLYSAQSAVRNLVDPFGYQDLDRRAAAEAQQREAHERLEQAKQRYGAAQEEQNALVARARQAQAQLTNATDFLIRLPPDSALSDVRHSAPRPLATIQSDLTDAREALTALLMRPRPELELHQIASAFVAQAASSLNAIARLDSKTDAITVLFGNSSTPSPLALAASLQPLLLTDWLTAQLRNLQRGTGDPIPKAERAERDTALRTRLANLEHEAFAAAANEGRGVIEPHTRPEVILGVRIGTPDAGVKPPDGAPPQPGDAPVNPLQHPFAAIKSLLPGATAKAVEAA